MCVCIHSCTHTYHSYSFLLNGTVLIPFKYAQTVCELDSVRGS